ncbi:hypothetical protein, partial [Streptomyces sp. NPDC058572]|uniref:hypothetical protein n=1 Tax=Streptomyces sp. NPDC058572 TaxID=3346546 RepID=UPI0036460993
NSSVSETDGWTFGLGGDLKPGGVGAALSAAYKTETTRTLSTTLAHSETFSIGQGATALPGHKVWIDKSVDWAAMQGTLLVRYKAKAEIGSNDFGPFPGLPFSYMRGVEYELNNYQFLSPVTPDPSDTTLIPRSALMTVDELRRPPSQAGCGLPDLAFDSDGIFSRHDANGRPVIVPTRQITDNDDATAFRALSKKGLWWGVSNGSPDRKVWIVHVKWGAERCNRYDLWGKVPVGVKDRQTRITTVVGTGSSDTVVLDEATRAYKVELRCLDARMPDAIDGPATLRSFEVYPEL